VPPKQRSIRTRVLSRWASLRGLLPFGLQDTLFHLPVSEEASTPALCARRGWTCVDLGPRGDRIPNRLALRAGDCFFDIARNIMHPSNARAFAATIPGGRVLGIACSAIAPEGRVLVDVSPHWGVAQGDHRALSAAAIALPPKRLSGTSALIGAVGHRNFYHWMYDVLPRIGLLREAGFAEPDHWIVANPGIPIAFELLERAGIPHDRVCLMRRGSHVECERLLVTSAPGEICQPVPRSARFVLETLNGAGGSSGRAETRLLYVPRRGRRKIANEEVLRPILARAGFVEIAMEGLTLDKQVEAFHGASVVVAPHGAGLSHLPHAATQATVLELFPPQYSNASFFMLAGACGFRYGALRGEMVNPCARSEPSADDFVIDPDLLTEAIELVIAG
jgi:capsular polysaccharide biosynthesis protein